MPPHLLRKTMIFAIAVLSLTMASASVQAAKKSKKAKKPNSSAWDKQDFPAKDKICFAMYTLNKKILKMVCSSTPSPPMRVAMLSWQ